MSFIRSFAKSCVVLFFGSESRPRTILRGLASGYRICISPAEQLGYLLGTDEPHLQKAIRNHVAAGDTVYDIGANVGTSPCHSPSGSAPLVASSPSNRFREMPRPFVKILKSTKSPTCAC